MPTAAQSPNESRINPTAYKKFTLEEFVCALGAIEWNGEFKARCPLPQNHKHGDRNPSLSLWLDKNGQPAMYCWGHECKKGPKKLFRAAVAKCREGKVGGKKLAKLKIPLKRPFDPVQELRNVENAVNQRRKSPVAIAFLKERGISEEVADILQLGYENKKNFLYAGEQAALVIPIFLDGVLVGEKFKTLTGPKDHTQVMSSRVDILYGVDCLDPFDHEEVLVVEGPPDFALAFSHGFNVVAINDSNAKISKGDQATLQKYTQVFLIGDMDESGQGGMDELQTVVPETYVRVSLGRFKDLGEVYSNNPALFKDRLRALLMLAADAKNPSFDPINENEATTWAKERMTEKYVEADVEPQPHSVAVTPNEKAPTETATGIQDMSDHVLDGRLGEICQRRMLFEDHFPIAYAWPALVTVAGTMTPWSQSGYSKNPKTRDDIKTRSGQTNLFTGLVGPVHSGKSQAGEYAQGVLGIPQGATSEEIGRHEHCAFEIYAGSAEMLFERLDHEDIPNTQRGLLFMDELKYLLDKAHIQGSSYTTLLQRAFYFNDLTLPQRRKQPLHIRLGLSILGGLVDDEFDEAFGASTTGGLYDRCLFGQNPTDVIHNYVPFNGVAEKVTFNRVTVDPSVWEAVRAWKKEQPELGRVAEIALRVKTICAAADGKQVLYGKDLDDGVYSSVKALANYSMGVRARLRPNPGVNPNAIASNVIRGFLERNGGWVSLEDLKKRTNYTRYGPELFDRQLNTLVRVGDVEKYKEGHEGAGRTKTLFRFRKPEEENL
jgi:hypothetical protein